MDTSATDVVREAFEEGRPVVLVAGQGFDSLGTQDDLALLALMRRLGVSEAPPRWPLALNRGAKASDMEWLAEQFSRSVPSEAALTAYDLPWSAVFTSSIDPNFSQRFETRGRQPEAVLSSGTFARVPRSRSRPPVHYLLGRAGESSPDAAPPLNRAALKRRTSLHATELMNRISETVTARGVVVIAGYSPANDWLPLDDVLAPLSERPGNRVVWFSPSDFEDSAFASDMIAAGSLVLEKSGLGAVIAGPGASWADFTASSTPDDPSMVTLADGVLDVTPAVRLRVEASAAVVDDSWTVDPEPLQSGALADAFRRFHGDLAGFRGRIEGIARGFAIERAFEHDLLRVTEATLRRLGQSDGVIIVHGQSGTGKSVALARLAKEIRERLRLPVLVATTRIPSYADIDAFCAEAERNGATATVLLCDANYPIGRYTDLASAAQSRGRRLLIVGTCYYLDRAIFGAARQLIEAPSTLSKDEVTALQALLETHFEIGASVKSSEFESSSALAMLYRSISHGREHIRSRVNAEARATEADLRARSMKVPTATVRSKLADQLIAAGIADESAQIFNDETGAAAIGNDTAGRLIDYVMVAGRLNCPVPLNLLMRLLTQNTNALEIDQIIHLFAGLDIFRWHSANKEGTDILISPRLQLEAELICRGRLGDTANEIGRIVEIIKNTRLTGVDRQAERTFLLDLLQKLDRDGPRGDAYREGYLAFGETLTALRERHGVAEASLMVRECVFRRQAVFSQFGNQALTAIDDDRRLSILDEARSVVEEAFRLIDAGKLYANKRTRQNLASERASIYGYLAVQRGRLNDGEGAWSDYLAAKAASARAIALSEDYHPIDIALWTSADVLKGPNITDDRKIELVADMYASLDLVDTGSLGINQKIRYLDRKTRIASVIGDNELSFAALEALRDIAPAAATFLVAKSMAAVLDTSVAPYTPDQRLVAGRAASYIAGQNSPEVADDARCARLLLRLRWGETTGQELLRGDRGRTPFGSSQIADLLQIVSGINERAGLASRNSERYLEAVLTWLSKDASRAIAMWRSLSRDSEFEDRSRVVRRLLATDEAGVPVKYRGRVEGAKGSSDWKVRVEGLNTSISLLAHEFSDQDLAHGRELRDFGIAFNYVGPIADPLTRSGSRR